VIEVGLTSKSRVRLVRQTEIAECGLAALAMVAGYHGLEFDLHSIRGRFTPSLRGTSLRSLMAMAESLKLSPRAVKLDLHEMQKLQLPCILHWNMNHYVVLESVKQRKALIHDPNGRSKWIDFDEISKHFTGVALELSPTAEFDTGSFKSRLKLRQLWARVSGLKRSLSQIVILTIILQAYVLITPYFMQVSIDRVLPSMDFDLLLILAIGFGLMTIINFGAELLRSFVLLFTGTKLGFSLASNLGKRLFRLPLDWFERRSTGDVLSRFQSVTPIQTLLTRDAVAAIVDGLMAMVTLIVMFWYSSLLASVCLLALLIFAIVRMLLFSAQKDAEENSIVSVGKEQTTLIETLRGITALRLFGRELHRHEQWQNKLADAMNADVRKSRIEIYQATANTLIFGLENIIIIYLGIRMVMIDEQFTVGMIFAFVAYKMQFIQKSTALVNTSFQFKMLSLHLERLSDIALHDLDKSFLTDSYARADLRGEIELKGVSYRYSATDPLVLDDINLFVKRGDHIAITGPSGGGKSTLVRILLGLSEPDDGEVLVDGVALDRFGYKAYHSQIAAVLQEDSLFAGSLADNIALFDSDADFDRIIEAAKAASIHNDIERMAMGYETLVGDMGSALSGGQKQRVLLARALYRKPKLLVMDEGTAHLDATHESRVNEAVSNMGITRIIIAHRQETIAAADRVYVLGGGKLHPLEQGTRVSISVDSSD